MPRRRAKTRIELLADALATAKQTENTLKLLDLRQTRGPLRDHLKAARDAADSAQRQLEQAILVEEPPPIVFPK